MNNTDDRSEQARANDKADATGCGSGCDCNTPGLSTKVKGIVCFVVILAAVAVLARGMMNKAEAENECNEQLFATALPAVQTEEVTAQATNASGDGKPSLWESPLASLASLNDVASDKDAVFVLIPSDDEEKMQTIKKQIEGAAAKITAQGTAIAAFTLDKNVKDYAQITNQAPAPCVLTIVKGRGMSVVAEDITEASLLQAVVTASRPSGCGPSGCGPSGCE